MANKGDIKKEEIQPNFPKRWNVIPFKNGLLKSGKFTKLKSSQYLETGIYPIIDQGEKFIAGYTNDESHLYDGELPVIIFGDHTRNIKFIDFEFAVGADGTKIFKSKEEIDSRFFYYYIKTLKIPSFGYSRHFKVFEYLDFPLLSLTEQKRIVNKLDEVFGYLDNVREKMDRIPELLKNFRQQVLTQAVTGELTKEWRNLVTAEGEKLSDPEVIVEKLIKKRELLIKQKKVRKVDLKETDKNDNLGQLPRSWKKMSLIEVANIIDPNPSHRMPEYVNEGVPFISTENINGNQLDFQKGRKVAQKTLEEQIKRFDIKEGDFLFTRIGTIGKSCYLPVKREYALSHAVCVISSYLPDQLHPSFLKIILSSKLILDQSQDGIQSVGVPDLGMGKVRAFQIPLTSVEEQNEILNRVENLFEIADKIESQYQSLKAKIDQLPQAILTKAFRGELVEQEVKGYEVEEGVGLMAAEPGEGYEKK